VNTLYLLRHGVLGNDNSSRFVGQIDLPLAHDGLRQAQALARALRDRKIGAIYSSDLLRTRQTAEIIAGEAGIHVIESRGLREISLGNWEGLSRSEVTTSFSEQYAARGNDIVNYRIPGGESFADCRLRALAAWEQILNCESDHIVVVSHAGINRLLLCHLLGMPITQLFHLAQDYGCVNIVQQTGESICVKLVNGRSTDICGGKQ
jgi:probable phosphoglycerate mutase